jgi:outer membrane protein TolC
VTAPPVPDRVVFTLDEALSLAEARSEQLAIAQAGARRAEAGIALARSERFPQLFGSASYDRALASEFSGLFEGSGPPCEPLAADPTAPLEDRVTELERAYGCPSGGLFGGSGEDGGDADLPFGRKDTWRLGLVFEQAIYAGGRIAAQERQARLGRSSADNSVISTRAQLVLDVSRAFFDAALSDRFVLIAEATYDQADRAYAQTRVQREAGRVSEFELLRAQVARDTLEPDVIRQRSARDLAYLQLKQLLGLPARTRVDLAVQLDAGLPPAERFGHAIAAAESGGALPERTGIRSAGNDVASREEAVTIARAERLPTVYANSSYGLVNYSGVPDFDGYRTNWSVGARVSVPILTGGRVRANEAIARADLDEARERLALSRELAALDEESARRELVAARAAWQASASTVQQAQRAYEIAELRYKEGLSTQLELSDARLLLQQAEANRAQAGRDLQIARVRLAVLPDLPLTTPGASGLAATTQRLTTAAAVTNTFSTQSGASAGAAVIPGAQQ